MCPFRLSLLLVKAPKCQLTSPPLPIEEDDFFKVLDLYIVVDVSLNGELELSIYSRLRSKELSFMLNTLVFFYKQIHNKSKLL